MLDLNPDLPVVKSNLEAKKARVLRHRDMQGRPIIYIPARNHNVNERDLEELTKFIVYCLVMIFYFCSCLSLTFQVKCIFFRGIFHRKLFPSM